MALKVIVGLGNPGLEYENTRHNAGFLLLDRLSTAIGAQFRDSKPLRCAYAKLKHDGQDLLLVKPLTYMNLSGESVSACLHFYKAEPSHLLVIHDDVSLPLGRLRFQVGGGAGGQHGIESIIKCLSGSKSFDRLKIGVGPDPGGARRANYVLGRFSQDDWTILDKVFATSKDGLLSWISRDTAFVANKYNNVNFAPAPPPPEVAPQVMPNSGPKIESGENI
ncbi:MAG: peptidyl-tRNA hydrolase, family [Cyanobacteriota bacterium erpe_2018_sw_39hr_WHONDRS-SW48-000098_B_bin.30]|jgi:PTH1 family peptidyl-tRNA hydrolase|nr:aminoacyl-tRNA hydrolase [Candidatus Obscuribacter sp.]MBK9622476.1 aminoacyl-tRNA hydrolase [Candidatus Obscuribacter sp.]MDQ5964788.1 peptidyl-tRNA hydrolase, family [Cyanobacteriota bacterium erpe_2018_sw_39hr_WHONDRS-SW48-000098_B_bin.30]